MTTHELARLLLEAENLPVYLDIKNEDSEENGFTEYKLIEGLNPIQYRRVWSDIPEPGIEIV